LNLIVLSYFTKIIFFSNNLDILFLKLFTSRSTLRPVLSCKYFFLFKVQWKPLNEITLGLVQSDHINQTITITGYFKLVIFGKYKFWNVITFRLYSNLVVLYKHTIVWSICNYFESTENNVIKMRNILIAITCYWISCLMWSNFNVSFRYYRLLSINYGLMLSFG